MKKICMIILALLTFFVDFYVNAEYERIYNSEDLSDYFSTMKACDREGGDNDCRNGNEYKFYLKMYDMYYLYQNKYNIKLDLPLIMAALYYGNEQLPVVFEKNLNSYPRADLKNNSVVTNLDWEFDYKNMDCYTYLNSADFRFDMQILAKNMVKKETTYDCVVENEEASEDEDAEEYIVVDTVTVDDIEKDNYSTDTLACDEGEYDENSINESYSLDMEKFKAFLLEYVKAKYHTKGTPIKECPVYDNGNNVSSSNSYTGPNGRDIVLSPTGSATIDQLNQIAVKQIGNTGDTYESWFGFYADWCAMFVSWLFNQVGGIGKYIASSEAVAGEIPRSSDAAGLGTWLEDECTNPEVEPRAGDIILFDPWMGSSYVPYPDNGNDKYYSSHVGYVYKVDSENVYSVEGNGELGGYNGVWEHVRPRKHCGNQDGQTINGYFRPNY